jgi:hypothetical protein
MASILQSAKSIRPFVVGACAFLLVIQLILLVLRVPSAAAGHADFSQLYTAGYMVRSGHSGEIYDYASTVNFQSQVVSPRAQALPFDHLAYEAILFAPLSFFPYPIAYAVFFIVNLSLLGASFIMLRPCGPSLEAVWNKVPITIVAGFAPVGIALYQGQDSLILLTLLVCSFTKLERDHDFASGVFLGLTLFKFQYSLPIALLFLVWKKWRVISGFATSSTLMIIASFAIAGPRAYATYLLAMSVGMTTPEQRLRFGINPLFMPNLRGLAFAAGGQRLMVTAALSILVLAWAIFAKPSFPIFVLTAMLVSYHGLIHDAAILILPLILLGDAAVRRNETWKIWLATGILFYPTMARIYELPYFLLAIPLLVVLVAFSERRSGEETWAARSQTAPIFE